jgi:hypothetical protein
MPQARAVAVMRQSANIEPLRIQPAHSTEPYPYSNCEAKPLALDFHAAALDQQTTPSQAIEISVENPSVDAIASKMVASKEAECEALRLQLQQVWIQTIKNKSKICKMRKVFRVVKVSSHVIQGIGFGYPPLHDYKTSKNYET